MNRGYLERKTQGYEAPHTVFVSLRAALDESRTNTSLSSPNCVNKDH